MGPDFSADVEADVQTHAFHIGAVPIDPVGQGDHDGSESVWVELHDGVPDHFHQLAQKFQGELYGVDVFVDEIFGSH